MTLLQMPRGLCTRGAAKLKFAALLLNDTVFNINGSASTSAWPRSFAWQELLTDAPAALKETHAATNLRGRGKQMQGACLIPLTLEKQTALRMVLEELTVHAGFARIISLQKVRSLQCFFFFFSWTFVSAPDLATHGNNLKLTLRTRRYGLREADVLSRNLALTSTRRVTFYGHSQTFTFTSNQYSVTSASWQIVLYLWQVFLSPR